jgi:uncharacterized membrane protein
MIGGSRFVFLEYITISLEFISVAVIIMAIIIALVMAFKNWKRVKEKHFLYKSSKIMVGRGILLGLELLIAADIIRSIRVEFNFTNIGLLGLIVIIRTVLSITLEVEIDGTWPWRTKKE